MGFFKNLFLGKAKAEATPTVYFNVPKNSDSLYGAVIFAADQKTLDTERTKSLRLALQANGHGKFLEFKPGSSASENMCGLEMMDNSFFHSMMGGGNSSQAQAIANAYYYCQKYAESKGLGFASSVNEAQLHQKIEDGYHSDQINPMALGFGPGRF